MVFGSISAAPPLRPEEGLEVAVVVVGRFTTHSQRQLSVPETKAGTAAAAAESRRPDEVL